MAATDFINPTSRSATMQDEIISEHSDVETQDMTSSLSPDSDMYKRIIQHQPIVLLRRIKIDNIPRVDGCLSDCDEVISSSPSSLEYENNQDSDEEWTAYGLSKGVSRKYCAFCSSSYGRQSDLDKHIRMAHGEVVMPFTCSVCGRGFMRQESLRHHKGKSCNGLVKKTLPLESRHQMTPWQDQNTTKCRSVPIRARGCTHKRTHCVPDSGSIDRIIAHLDFSLPQDYKDNHIISTICTHCKAIYLSRAAMIKHYRSAHKDVPMPYSCRNCSLGFLDVRGLKIHLAKSKRFCAKMVYAKTRGQSLKGNTHSHAQSTSSLTELPSFCSEDELLSYLGDRSRGLDGKALGGSFWCPICNRSVTGDILNHLRCHKQMLLACKKQNSFLCDICLIDSDSIEWMIKHRREAHGKSFLMASELSEVNLSLSSVKPSDTASAVDKNRRYPLVPVPMPQTLCNQSKTSCEPSHLCVTDVSNSYSSNDPTSVSSFSGALTDLQNVIEIKPVYEEGSAVCGNSIPDESIKWGSDSKLQVDYPLGTLSEHCPAPQFTSHDLDAGQSPGPPVLYPPANSFALVEESSCEMPDLCKESDPITGEEDDLIFVSTTRAPQKKQCPVIIKQEKGIDDFRSELHQQPLENRYKAGKCRSERSFMDALIPPIEPVCTPSSLTNTTNTYNSSITRSLLGENHMSHHKQRVTDDITYRDNHFLRTANLVSIRQTTPVENAWQLNEFFNDKSKNDVGASGFVSGLAVDAQSQLSENDAKMSDLSQRKWEKTESHMADSTESDSGVSEVKLEDEELQDEVIVIDLDDNSVIREYVTSDTGTERSLQPGEHKAMLRLKQESMNLEARDDYLEMLEKDFSSAPCNGRKQDEGAQDDDNLKMPDFNPRVSSLSSSSSNVVTNASQQRHEYDMLEDEKRLMLEKQSELFQKLEKFLDVISDKPISAPQLTHSSAAKMPESGEVSRLNGSSYYSIAEILKKKHHSKLLLKCDHCGKGFQSIGLLNKHKRFSHTHHRLTANKVSDRHDVNATPAPQPGQLKLRAYPCSKCGEYYPSLALLHDHKKVIHKLTSKYLCLQCDKSFASRGQLQSHMRWKHTQSKVKQLNSAAPVTMKAMLKQGYFPNLPTRSDPFGVESRDVNQQLQPNMTQGDEQPVSIQPPDYMCTLCGETFISLVDRQRHERMFCKMKRLPCGQCEETIIHDSSPMEQVKTHQNIRYICDVCGLAYLRMYSVRHHRQKHHPEAPNIDIKWLRVELDHLPSQISR
ncbi:hypothetical protein LSH36_1624g00001 [Paralvinella palmiformis]|uniref:C2H2-type domain-containing protein n=1 Tax=Paralvinella palmiformis TaxID=53620 RepID=A0AAD9IRY7_9ANNE|nr:hypothetical protein LSH36_1624g00001 [Paralvinella palmiformis]